MSSDLTEFDVIVVGGGPAGLSAGIVASLKGLNAAVFEGGTWGGLLSTIYIIIRALLVLELII
jgi:thioredoxin reductase (NADPH)